MNSPKHGRQPPASWDHFLGRYLKNWVARYPSPAGGRQRLLLAAALGRPFEQSLFWRFGHIVEGLIRAGLYQDSMASLPYDDLRDRTLRLAVHLHPAWVLCA